MENIGTLNSGYKDETPVKKRRGNRVIVD